MVPWIWLVLMVSTCSKRHGACAGPVREDMWLQRSLQRWNKLATVAPDCWLAHQAFSTRGECADVAGGHHTAAAGPPNYALECAGLLGGSAGALLARARPAVAAAAVPAGGGQAAMQALF